MLTCAALAGCTFKTPPMFPVLAMGSSSLMSGWLTAHFPRTAVHAVVFTLTATIAGCASGGHQPGQQGGAGGASGASKGAGAKAATSPAAFLRSYARPDGRVARPDQGGDTVSEGQAYAMLLAEVAGDNASFGRIWEWTRAHLQRGNGLFAYHADAAGRVLDPQPATDADLLIAWALLRYSGPGAAAYHAAGRRVADAVLAHEVVTAPGSVPFLAAGPWATGRPATLNPSYWSLQAMRGLARFTGDMRWQRLAAGAVSLTRQLTKGGRLLPPDWAELTSAGQLRPEPAPNGSVPLAQYGLDAQRTVVWF